MKKATAILCAAILCALCCHALAGPAPITLADPVVESVIRRQLAKPDGPLTQADMLRVWAFEYGGNLADTQKIASLDDLAMCANLRTLSLTDQPVDSLAALRGLALESITLLGVPVADLTPLGGMDSLRQFVAISAPIADWAPVLALPGLSTFVSFAGGAVDLSPLKETGALEVFFLRGVTRPVDYTPLAGHKGLRRVALAWLAEGALGPLVSNWPQLEGLEVSHAATTGDELAAVLAGRQITSLRLLDCPALGGLGALAGQHALVNLQLDQCGTLDLAPLAGLASLQRLDMRRTHAEDLSPLTQCPALRTLLVSDGYAGISLEAARALLPGVEVSAGGPL